MATTTKDLKFLTGDSAILFFSALGSGNLIQGLTTAWRLARQFAPLTNFWWHHFTMTTTGGGATDSETIHFYNPVLLAILHCDATDLDTISIHQKVNEKFIQISGSSQNAAAELPAKMWGALDDVPILEAVDKDDDYTLYVTDTGAGQSIDAVLIGYLLPPKAL